MKTVYLYLFIVFFLIADFSSPQVKKETKKWNKEETHLPHKHPQSDEFEDEIKRYTDSIKNSMQEVQECREVINKNEVYISNLDKRLNNLDQLKQKTIAKREKQF